mgnify:CR=1 FL=1
MVVKKRRNAGERKLNFNRIKHSFSIFSSRGHDVRDSDRNPSVSCIIPAFNEETTIAAVLKKIKKVRTISEIIVVDDGSTDSTRTVARAEGAKVVSHESNLGKGAAIKTGFANSRGDILLFLDADLASISPKKIASILQPIEADQADFVKTSFYRKRGRVTELVVKPLFKVIFPFVNFNQPLSGQFALKRELIRDLKIDDKWGVDIQILLQLMKCGVRIAEVDIGHLIHKKQPIENLTVMSEQVIKAILSELGLIANKHKLIIFDFDKTLVKESSIEVLAKAFGFTKELKKLRRMHERKRIKDYEITLALSNYLKGKSPEDIEKLCRKIHISKNAAKVIEQLKKKQYRIAIISVAFYPVVRCIAKKIGIDEESIICPVLGVDGHGAFTGEVIAKTTYNSKCCDKIICKADAAEELMHRLDVKPEECIAVGDGKSDECLFRVCGLSLAYKTRLPIGDVKIMDMSEILVYAE